MSVQSGPTYKRYAANGIATVFAIPFLVINASDLAVTLNGVAVTSGFTLSGLGNPTCSATFTVAPTGDLLFQMNIPIERLTDYQTNGDLLAKTINLDLDRLWLAIKQNININSRALATSTLEPEGVSPLPVVALRMNKVLSFDANGNPVPSNLTLEQLEQQAINSTAAANAAAQSAAAAALSEASANTAANSAAASYDSFDDRYLGAKSADPTLDNDGNALLIGAIYWNTTNNLFRVWNGAAWQNQNSADFLNSLAINVASAATVSLTASAPNTRNINITGTTTITAFTVAAGQLYFVRFSASLTLTNNAAIVTQSGASIVTQAGDTCIVRATAANVVEILGYTPFKNQAIGYEQSMQDMTASRAMATSYTNNSGKTIIALIMFSATAAGSVVDIRINGNTVQRLGSANINGQLPLCMPVKPGDSISAVLTAGTISIATWWELR